MIAEISIFVRESYVLNVFLNISVLMYADQVLTTCDGCWQVTDVKCCWMALVMLS